MKGLDEGQIRFFLQHLKEHLEKTAYQEHDYEGKVEKYGFMATPYYRYIHTLKVLEYALTICEGEGARRDVVALAAIFHDLERYTTPPLLHGHKGAIMSQKILLKHGISEETALLVYNAIYHHVGQESLGDLSLEGAILVEADRLDKLGNKGIMVHFMIAGRNDQTFQEAAKSFQEFLIHRGHRTRKFFRTATGQLLLEEKIKEQESFLETLKSEVVLEEEVYLANLFNSITEGPF